MPREEALDRIAEGMELLASGASELGRGPVVDDPDYAGVGSTRHMDSYQPSAPVLTAEQVGQIRKKCEEAKRSSEALTKIVEVVGGVLKTAAKGFFG